MWTAALYDADDAKVYDEYQMMMEMQDPDQDNADQQNQYEQQKDATDDAAQEWDEMQTQHDEDPQEQDGYYDGDWGYPTGYVDYPVEVMA
jgi:hypothetical protein